MSTRLLLPAVLVAAGLGPAACGGGSSSSAGSTTTTPNGPPSNRRRFRGVKLPAGGGA